MHREDFEEIAHCGGQIIFDVSHGPNGERQLQLGMRHSRPNPSSVFVVYAIPQGVAIAYVPMGGIGVRLPAPPIPGAYMVFIASDSDGMFGHNCPDCEGYWRSAGAAHFCPYCGLQADQHQFLSVAQQTYVAEYCERLSEALSSDQPGQHVIDMDLVADAAGKNTEKPAFYYSEKSQQNKFTCTSCKNKMDILGHYGYCSQCGTRNDIQQLEKSIQQLRENANNGAGLESCTKEIVGVFDSFVNQIAKQLLARVPLTKARRHAIEKRSLHNLEAINRDFQEVFGISMLTGLSDEDVAFTKLMFYRRNVYEHNGGEADEAYIASSGDTSVRLKQALRETKESFHRLASTIRKLGENLHRGFHEILPPSC